jgi:hypothetical protein
MARNSLLRRENFLRSHLEKARFLCEGHRTPTRAEEDEAELAYNSQLRQKLCTMRGVGALWGWVFNKGGGVLALCFQFQVETFRRFRLHFATIQLLRSACAEKKGGAG